MVYCVDRLIIVLERVVAESEASSDHIEGFSKSLGGICAPCMEWIRCKESVLDCESVADRDSMARRLERVEGCTCT